MMGNFIIGVLIAFGSVYAVHAFTADDANYDQTYVVQR